MKVKTIPCSKCKNEPTYYEIHGRCYNSCYVECSCGNKTDIFYNSTSPKEQWNFLNKTIQEERKEFEISKTQNKIVYNFTTYKAIESDTCRDCDLHGYCLRKGLPCSPNFRGDERSIIWKKLKKYVDLA